MNESTTAPKDGTIFLANFGQPLLVCCCWNEASNKWIYANPQTDMHDGDWCDRYFDNEWEDESYLKGWIPLPTCHTIAI
jgi:hypothetical protein